MPKDSAQTTVGRLRRVDAHYGVAAPLRNLPNASKQITRNRRAIKGVRTISPNPLQHYPFNRSVIPIRSGTT
jgi:hypothetical protein